MDNKNKKFPTPRGASATAAKRKYNEKNYDRFELSLPKGMKEKIDEVAEAAGYKSRRSFILDIIAEKYEQVMGRKINFEEPKSNIPPGLEGMTNITAEEIEAAFDGNEELPF